ncbi:MAG: 4Fe-4S binding protein, partial [Deltaproteobacteria bacterium]|nr:4Fe-4S binding protein [Deltaproteobacteria bacterium]
DTSCKHCGACARHCPRQAIKMVGGQKKTPYWTWRCEACMRCMGFCRHQSVQASHLWAFVVIYGASFLSGAFIQDRVLNSLFPAVSWQTDLAAAISWILAFLALMPLYWLFFGLQRILPLRLLFTYTTLTKLYRRRYHAPGTRAKEMTRAQQNARKGKNKPPELHSECNALARNKGK